MPHDTAGHSAAYWVACAGKGGSPVLWVGGQSYWLAYCRWRSSASDIIGITLQGHGAHKVICTGKVVESGYCKIQMPTYG
jgi:hypothetical protein